MVGRKLIERTGSQQIGPAITHVRERKSLSFDPGGNDGCPHAILFGVGGCSLIHSPVRQVDGARQAIRALGNVGLWFSEDRRGAAIFSLLAVRHDRLHRELACHLAMRLSPHSVRQDIHVQRGLYFVTIFVVLSDTPKVGARSGLNAQEGPHSVGYTVAWVSEVFPVAEPYSCTTLRRI